MKRNQVDFISDYQVRTIVVSQFHITFHITYNKAKYWLKFENYPKKVSKHSTLMYWSKQETCLLPNYSSFNKNIFLRAVELRKKKYVMTRNVQMFTLIYKTNYILSVLLVDSIFPQCTAQRKQRSCAQTHNILINWERWWSSSRKILENKTRVRVFSHASNSEALL